MKRAASLAFLAILFCCGGDAARACTCISGSVAGDDASMKQWFAEFDVAMFTGRVKSIERVEVREEDGYPHPMLKVTFAVERFWKGVEGADAVILTGIHSAACGVPYSLGKRYFVVAYRRRGAFETDICTAPRRYSDHKIFVKGLGKGSKPGPQAGGIHY